MSWRIESGAGGFLLHPQCPDAEGFLPLPSPEYTRGTLSKPGESTLCLLLGSGMEMAIVGSGTPLLALTRDHTWGLRKQVPVNGASEALLGQGSRVRPCSEGAGASARCRSPCQLPWKRTPPL